ncbi:cysteine desulfurase family protein [Enterobacteriaceae endosymbiont of Neohaemonia nigricornis]|uniref:cysteine desulfurase family protein n=1 Tax=Enterobacteriaceae endosymbiont of Neohaemonia nigricornis TaxID=2675792 RepID=UPI001449D579|nr:cysteine desulfurase family protein [Enterobacteriaceae endosymbiont of Neohaemonia nigricornis]QJC30530.1 aminotransferase class V-fold PLP-dependent enzyme [Enterobacteriaceae endosymbiont of Neohaemonia nigricornis]
MNRLNKKIIYLDNAATTPIDKKVAKKMYFYLKNYFGNPASTHYLGLKVNQDIIKSRKTIIKILGGTDPNNIIFTSTASESNNLAIKGIIYNYQCKKHIITCVSEHKSILETCFFLEKKKLCDITYLKINKYGLIDLTILENSIKNETILVSIMHINNEIGVIQNIKKIGKICKKHNILFHVDATQSIGKFYINVLDMNIDLMSFSAHKFYGPKGIGILYTKFNNLIPLIHGGAQENNIRSGTLATHQIIGLTEALHLSYMNYQKNLLKITKFKQILWNGIKNIKDIYINGDFKNSTPYIINIRFNNIFNKLLLTEMQNIAVSISSACTSNNYQDSHVLQALGLTTKEIQSSIRISFGKFNTIHDINNTIITIHKAIKKLKII